MPKRSISIPSALLRSSTSLADTVRGAKDPVLVGPTDTWWSTRTPDGLGTISLKRATNAVVDCEAWGPGATWLLNQAPLLLGDADDLTGWNPTGPVKAMWLRRPFLMSRTDRPWDALIGGVLGQKVQTTKAKQSRRQLARKFGDPAPGPRESWILPGPDVVGDMGYHQFHPLGVERKRAETLIRTAKEMRRLTSLTGRQPDEVRMRLQRIRGIGPWTAAMVTAASMGDADAVPVGDFHIPNTVAWHLAGEPRATDQRMLELLEPFAGHRWRVIRLAKGSGGAPKYGPRLSLTSDGLHRGA